MERFTFRPDISRLAMAIAMSVAATAGVAPAAAASPDSAAISWYPLLSTAEQVSENYSRQGADNGYVQRLAAQTKSVGWELGALFAGITAVGVRDWNWGSSSFKVNSEGWFGRNTGSLGMDKLGHAWTTYVLTDFLTDRINRGAAAGSEAEATAFILSMGLMTYVEVLDGFSVDHGFSYEDIVMNGLGAGFSVLRRKVPGLREKLDFRLEYLPSGNIDGFHPITDYSGQKYVLALKFAGFDGAEKSLLRFVELHAGYYARGFTEAERERFEPLRREPYVGIGINLSELLLGGKSVRDRKPARIARRVLEYIQVPYTYAATSMK